MKGFSTYRARFTDMVEIMLCISKIERSWSMKFYFTANDPIGIRNMLLNEVMVIAN